MNNPIAKIAVYTASIIISSLPFALDSAEADDEKPQKRPTAVVSSPHIPKLDSKFKILEEKSQHITEEAKDVLEGTEQAVSLLSKKDTQKAMETLRRVSGKLDILLAQSPGLAFIPANVSIRVEEFTGDEETVKTTLDIIDDLFEDGKIQAARQLIDELVSEMDVTTIRIPLAVFPSGIRNAMALANTGKTEEATDALYTLMNSVETITEVMPLPVLRAEEFLTTASALEQKRDLSKQVNREEIINLADAARNQLKLAVLLGYGSKDNYKELHWAIDEMKATIHYSAGSQPAWDSIARSFAVLKNSLTLTRKIS